MTLLIIWIVGIILASITAWWARRNVIKTTQDLVVISIVTFIPCLNLMLTLLILSEELDKRVDWKKPINWD